MSGIAKEDLLNLSIEERLQLLEDLWESINNEPESIQLSDELKLELDVRLASYKNDPSVGAEWDIVRQRIMSRK